ncbi:MAG: TylF/MycF/NovP-related O-methyltransferase [Bryobacteraceae bacterium]
MKAWTQGVQYAYRYVRHKYDAFQAFGPAGANGGGLLPHSVVRPVATYSPWRADPEFQTAFELVHPNTLVDIYRCYDLWNLVEEAGKLPSGDIIEIGVWRGGTGCLMAKRAKLAGLLATVYLCDTFQGVVKAGSSDRHYAGGEHADTSEATVTGLAHRLGLDNIKIVRGIFPEETGHQLANASFRLCHIDVDVYDSGRDILAWIWPRLTRGGMVVFDDYGCLSTGGITRLVNEERGKLDRLMLHNLNGHAVFVKL